MQDIVFISMLHAKVSVLKQGITQFLIIAYIFAFKLLISRFSIQYMGTLCKISFDKSASLLQDNSGFQMTSVLVKSFFFFYSLRGTKYHIHA